MRKRPDDWRADARNALTVRNIQPAHQRLLGDSEFAAQLLTLAQTVLGGLRSHLALGGIQQGARKVALEDGSLIRVVCNGDLQIIEIDRRAAEAGIQAFFLVHPHADAAPNGWWWPTSETTARAVMEGYYYPKQSYYSLEGVDTSYWWEAWNRPNAILVANPTGCVLVRDQDLWCGNQAVTSPDGTVWSWWHSPHGDAPLYVQAGGEILYRAWHTPYYQGSLQVTVNYDAPTWNSAVLTPCVFRDSALVWSYSDDNLGKNFLGFFENEIDADDSAIIGGVYPVTYTRILVVVLTNAARTATLWDVHLSPPSGSTKTSVWTATVGTDHTYAMRWPWRFKPDGTECSTIVAYTLDSPAGGGAKYTEYKIWTMTISYNEGTDAFSVSQSESEAYSIRHRIDSVSESSGTLTYPSYGTVTTAGSVNEVVDSDHAQIPLACAYGPNGSLRVAWLDVTGSTVTTTNSSESTGAAPGDYSSSSSGNASTTESATIRIDGFSYTLTDTTITTTSSASRELLYVGNASVTTGGSLSSAGTRKRLLFLDVLTKKLILYSNQINAEGSSTLSASWPPGESGPKLGEVSGSTAYQGGNALWYLDTLLLTDPAETSVDAVASYVDYPVFTPTAGDFNFSTSDTSYNYELTPDQSALSLDLGFGMAIDRHGFFLFSYEIKERDENLGGTLITLDRKTGAHSNIPGFKAALAFGENPLLFPLGLGRRSTAV